MASFGSGTMTLTYSLSGTSTKIDSLTFHPNYVSQSIEKLDTYLSHKNMVGGSLSRFSLGSSLEDISVLNCRLIKSQSFNMGGGLDNKLPRSILKKSISADEACIQSLRDSMMSSTTSRKLSSSHSESCLSINIPLLIESTDSQCSPKSQQKNVTFADDNNLSLVEIRNFIPSNDSLNTWTHSMLCRRSMLHCGGSIINEMASSSTPTNEGNAKVIKRPVELLICFKEPCSASDFHEQFERQCVALERCGTRDRTVTGIILVKNIEFQKQVTVRYTLDHWKTSDDIETSYVPNSNDGVTDRFTFSLSLPKTCKELEFAVRYKTSSEEFWDNNHNRNYKVKDATAL